MNGPANSLTPEVHLSTRRKFLLVALVAANILMGTAWIDERVEVSDERRCGEIFDPDGKIIPACLTNLTDDCDIDDDCS